MARKEEATKLITVESYGSIKELGGIAGPIINPTLQPVSIVEKMVAAKRRVYEVNPANLSEKVLLTLHNVHRDNFKTAVTPAVTSVAKPEAKQVKTVVADKTEEKSTGNIKDSLKGNNNSDFTKK